MSDEVLTIKLTERELDLIMDLLHEAGLRTDADGQPATEICHDLMEQTARPGEWHDSENPDLLMDPAKNHTFTVMEEDFIQAGIDAREKAKESSRAAARREARRANETRIFSASLILEQLSAAPVTKPVKFEPINFGEFGLKGTASMAVHRKHVRKAPRFRESVKESDLSETQRFDLWDDRDPRNW
jgi:hypothetical protein